jgi:hypothetical protein
LSDTYISLLLSIHLAATFYMIGIIWLVQLVQYPLFASVGNQDFPTYERGHQSRIAWVVGPGMLIEGMTAASLLLLAFESWRWWAFVFSCLLLLVIWLSTAFVQVPCHRSLAEAYSSTMHRRLVQSNWIRTIAWTLRGCIVLGLNLTPLL